RQVGFPYERDRRRKGRATYTVWRLLDLAVSGIVSFSVVPLRLVVLAGAAISALSLAAGLVVLLRGMPVLAVVVAALAFCSALQPGRSALCADRTRDARRWRLGAAAPERRPLL